MPGVSSSPIIVCVFPEDVTPYAKMVPFSPSSTEDFTIDAPTVSYTASF